MKLPYPRIIDTEGPRVQWTLRRIRKELRRTQTEVARRMRVSQSFISRLERAKTPDLLSVWRYGAALDGDVRIYFCAPNGHGWRELDILQWDATDERWDDEEQWDTEPGASDANTESEGGR